MRSFIKWILLSLLFGILCLLGASFMKNDTSLIKDRQNEIIGGASHTSYMAVNTKNKPVSNASVDIDLASMKSNMIYATVYDMMTNQDKYMGKKMRMSGLYDKSYDTQTEKYYHYVVIEDAMACCQQGMEFVFSDFEKPEDFPSVNKKIEVVGVFGSYEEMGNYFFYIEAEEVKW